MQRYLIKVSKFIYLRFCPACLVFMVYIGRRPKWQIWVFYISSRSKGNDQKSAFFGAKWLICSVCFLERNDSFDNDAFLCWMTLAWLVFPFCFFVEDDSFICQLCFFPSDDSFLLRAFLWQMICLDTLLFWV